MRRSLIVVPSAAIALSAAIAPAAAAQRDHAAGSQGYTVTTLDFHVTVPNETLGGSGTQSCLIVGDLYKPADASPSHRVPVVLTTNGFGGSKDDQAPMARVLVQLGYGVLSYSGLGFGGSGCKISLDDPSYDGAAGSQLVSFLGGKTGIATTTSGAPYPAVDWIRHDPVDHAGHRDRYDPRVGMIGGSYGGEIQFAIADVDPRLDTIIPFITWNDLSYSLAPNDTGFVHGVTYSEKAPGAAKAEWINLFFGEGIVDGLQGAKVDPSRDVGCVNFLNEACVANAELMSNLVAPPSLFAFARHASVESYMHNIRIPTLLAQGQGDTLFNLQEATATYLALRRQGTPVKMIWQSWGHSVGTPAPGEWGDAAGMQNTYEGARVLAWFARYLKGARVSTGPNIAYYRDYVPFHGTGPDTVQYGTSATYPIGHPLTFYASGSSALVSRLSSVASGSSSYANAGGAAPTSYSETSAVQGSEVPDQSTPPRDGPGSFASWSTAPLTHDIDVVGMPTATLHVSAPTASDAEPGSELQMFVKVYDVAPDGSVDLVNRLVAAVRVLDPSKPVEVQLPGIVHQFAAGHRVELVVAATDSAYRNSNVVQPVTVTTSRAAPGVLRLPVVG
jgi:ABC-2 type transport system ATP-binding protein